MFSLKNFPLSKRIYTSEIMDDFSINDKRLDEALIELRIINKLLGGNSTSAEGLMRLLKNVDGKEIKILDAGSGASDILLELQRRFTGLKIYGVDKNLGACKYIKMHSPSVQIVCADVMQLPFKNNSFNVTHASLLLHHFEDNEISKMLMGFSRLSNKGIIINDLRRSLLAFWGIKILTKLFSQSDMVKNDAPLSVKRGFSKSEMISIIKSFKVSFFKLKRKWAFRWLLIIFK